MLFEIFVFEFKQQYVDEGIPELRSVILSSTTNATASIRTLFTHLVTKAKITISPYPIGWCDDAIEILGDGAGCLYFIIVDCAQGYHQIRAWWRDQEKLDFFALNGEKYTYTVNHLDQ